MTAGPGQARSDNGDGSAILTGQPLVHVIRGDRVESVHHIAACAVDGAGRVIYAVGSIDVPVYWRSSAKPFIAAAVVRSGAVERFGLDQHEVAVMAASHAGEPFHIEAVRSILNKIGLSEEALQCGSHAPYNATAARALEENGERFTTVHNNCSGKHAGILALCLMLGCNIATYTELNNPAQQVILALCGRLTGQDPKTFPVAVDGCGIPAFAASLESAALAFMRFATLDGIDARDAQALKIVRDAMIAHPRYVAGTGEFDSALMEAGNGAIACKAGAEGVHGDALIDERYGYVQKVLDGAKRAVAPAVMAALYGLGGAPAAAELESFAQPAIANRAGAIVGEIRAKAVARAAVQNR